MRGRFLVPINCVSRGPPVKINFTSSIGFSVRLAYLSVKNLMKINFSQKPCDKTCYFRRILPKTKLIFSLSISIVRSRLYVMESFNSFIYLFIIKYRTDKMLNIQKVQF